MKIFIAFFFLLFPVSAFAHAFPVAYSPDGFSLNSIMPSDVMIRFSQGVLSTGNGIEVFAPDGTKLPDAAAVVDAHGEYTLSRSVASVGNGIYVVSWHGVSSEDGHFTKGAFSFFVGATSSAPDFYGGSMVEEVEKMSRFNLDMERVIATFFVFLALSILIGSLTLSFLLRREKIWGDQIREQLIPHMSRFAYFALPLLFLGVVAVIILPMQFSPMKPSGLFGAVSLFADSIAVSALFVWTGSILASAFVCLPFLASQSLLLSLRAPLRAMIGRISAWALFVGAVSGTWSVWVHLKSWDNLTTTLWGSMLITLVLFVGVLLLLRCLSLFFLERTKRCVHCEWAYALLESGIGLCVLFFAALLLVTPSPIYNSPLWQVMRTDAERMITVTDLGEEDDTLRLRAYDAKGVPITTSLPLILLDNAKEGIGPLVVPVKDRGEGNYDIPGVLLTPRGEWRIAITFKQQSAYDINATIGIDYPREIVASRNNAMTPRFDAFATGLLCGALALSILSFVILFFVQRNKVFAVLHAEYDRDTTTIGMRKATIIAIVAFLSVIAIVVMLRMMLPFYSEKIPDGNITPMHMETMPHDMSGMQM